MRKKPKLSTLDDDSSQSGLSSFEAQSQEGERKKKPSINDVLGRRPRRTIKDEDDENRSFTDEEEDTNTVGDSLDGFVVSDDEDSFEDDDDSQSAALPSRLAFSDEGLPMRHMSAKMDFSEAYPIFLQYCVSSLLADDFEQLILETPDEGYFLPAKKKIEDFFVTRRKEVCSSVWDQAFLIKLHTYPRFRSWADKQTAHKCVACRRGKDTASWKVFYYYYFVFVCLLHSFLGVFLTFSSFFSRQCWKAPSVTPTPFGENPTVFLMEQMTTAY